MIDGVRVEPLKKFEDERGMVLHMLRAENPLFERFGEIYFSYVNPGFVKGWKQHLEMTQHFCVPVGNLRLVLFDDRPDSPTRGEVQTIEMGLDHYCLVKIPPQVLYSFSAVGEQPAMIANCADMPHRPDESVTRPLDDKEIPYQWT
ncbi:MAG: dTDP-4-dehydrorhamnose 3,5-epimerase family protein [Candidatus Omnitrophica bacterium]|nr:dTDP-4-dehydrorhamnose 3,5-epimerase family protein [Candidatus Omnitrophota bacterium]